MRVLIADDHALLRQGLIELLRAAEPGWSFQEAGSFPAVLQALDTVSGGESADLLVTDLRMPGMVGCDNLRALRSAYPRLLLAVLTAVDDRLVILDCLDAGVHGFIPKSSSTEQILQALRGIVGGLVYVPPLLARLAVPRSTRPTTGHSFTGRQIEVLELLAEGRSTKDIARTLNLGVGTVKVYLSAIYRILGAHNRMEAVMRAGAMRA
jgi:DNA-binding NarL/FixJ family response regulator